MDDSREVEAIGERYARRTRHYDPLSNWVLFARQEQERALAHLLRRCGYENCQRLKLLEVGCGTGDNLLLLLRLGFRPENLAGNELLGDRMERAAARLPAACRLFGGNAADLDAGQLGEFDIVYQSMVLSSILDSGLRARLASKMWELVKPGGVVLTYDFTFNNPANPDVRRVTFQELCAYFPGAHTRRTRVTLAPPLNRRIAKFGYWAYLCANSIPFLRTHLLCAFKKPVD